MNCESHTLLTGRTLWTAHDACAAHKFSQQQSPFDVLLITCWSSSRLRFFLRALGLINISDLYGRMKPAKGWGIEEQQSVGTHLFGHYSLGHHTEYWNIEYWVSKSENIEYWVFESREYWILSFWARRILNIEFLISIFGVVASADKAACTFDN